MAFRDHLVSDSPRPTSPFTSTPPGLLSSPPCLGSPQHLDEPYSVFEDAECLSDDTEGFPASPSSPVPRTARVARSKKVQDVCGYLDSIDLTPVEFMKLYMSEESIEGKAHKSVRRRNVLNAIRSEEPTGDDMTSAFQQCMDELDSLVGTPGFDNYDVVKPVDEVEIRKVQDDLHAKAPTWVAFLESAMSNKRTKFKSYKKRDYKDIVHFITALVLRQRSRKKSNHLVRKLGLYLYGNGAKRRVINVLSSLGACDT